MDAAWKALKYTKPYPAWVGNITAKEVQKDKGLQRAIMQVRARARALRSQSWSLNQSWLVALGADGVGRGHSSAWLLSGAAAEINCKACRRSRTR